MSNLTPEERANSKAADLADWIIKDDPSHDDMILTLSGQLNAVARAAVEAEREANAQLAEQYHRARLNCAAGPYIAAAIRQRGEGEV